MKKLIFILSILVCLSCSKESIQQETVQGTTYLYKVCEGYEYLLDNFSNVTDTTFVATDLDMLYQEANNEFNGYFEVFDFETGILLWPVREESVTGPLKKFKVDRDLTVLGQSYKLKVNFYQENGEDFVPFLNASAEGNPLISLCTSNKYLSEDDHQVCSFFARTGFFSTSDLNEDGGIKSDYTRLFSGGLSPDTPINTKPYSPYYSDVVTGMRLVMQNNDKYKESIVDSDGIEWNIVRSYCGSRDLNSGAAGDYLYLYYTNDIRTGRKIYLSHPVACNNLPVNENARYDDFPLAYRTLFNLTTWSGYKTYDVNADELIAAFGEIIASYDITPSENKQAIVKMFENSSSRRFDFVRLYDNNMNPVDSRPANFNRNARGDKDLFISYTFVTPDDAQWDNHSDGTEIHPTSAICAEH